MEKIEKGIGDLIREAREKKGLSQSELAKLMGVTRATVNGMEADRSSPTVNTLRKVAIALGSSLKIIFE